MNTVKKTEKNQTGFPDLLIHLIFSNNLSFDVG